jgi:hypothetical protein
MCVGLPVLCVVVGWQWLDGVSTQARSGYWPTTTATILRSETRWTLRLSTRLTIEYSYVVDGSSYTATRFHFNSLGSWWWVNSAGRFAEQNTPGDTLTIAYDSAHPARATIRSGLSLHDVWLAPLLVAGLGWGSLRCVREIRRRRLVAAGRSRYGRWACAACGFDRRGLRDADSCPGCGTQQFAAR